jgi:hypothetical protein
VVVAETEGEEVARVSRENRRLQKACERLREEKEAVEERVREGTIERASGLDEELEG